MLGKFPEYIKRRKLPNSNKSETLYQKKKGNLIPSDGGGA